MKGGASAYEVIRSMIFGEAEEVKGAKAAETYTVDGIQFGSREEAENYKRSRRAPGMSEEALANMTQLERENLRGSRAATELAKRPPAVPQGNIGGTAGTTMDPSSSIDDMSLIVATSGSLD